MSEKADEIKQYLDLSLDEIYSQIGARFATGRGTIGDRKTLGKKYYFQNKGVFFKKVCIEFGLCKKIESGIFNDNVFLLTAVSDFLSTITIGVPSMLVAVLLFKLGLRKFCQCGKCQDQNNKKTPKKRHCRRSSIAKK